MANIWLTALTLISSVYFNNSYINLINSGTIFSYSSTNVFYLYK